MTVKKSRRRGVVLSLQGQHKLDAARRQLEKALNGGNRFTLEELSDRTQLALSTITRVLDGQVGVDKQTLSQFFAAFDLTLDRTDYQPPHPATQPPTSPPLPTLPTSPPPPQPMLDWGEAIDVSHFYGRTSELATLTWWIQRENCRLVAILGMGGMGKTALSVKLAQQLASRPGSERVSEGAEAEESESRGANEPGGSAHQSPTRRLADPAPLSPPFTYIIWRTLRNAPPLDVLLADLTQVLSGQREALTSEGDLLSRLMHYLRQHRCLLVLDNFETILQGGQFAGAYRQGYEAYSELIRQVGELAHQSCLVLTSREKPETIAGLEGAALPVRSLALPGLPSADTDHLFDAIGLSQSPAGRHRLIDVYNGNPLALKIIGTSIQELFGGNVDAFLNEDTLVFNGIRRLLDQQMERLTPSETQVMFWLAINREWVTLADLQTDIVPALPKQRLLETLESLARRNLIEQKHARFTQQPVVMEYMTERLIEQVLDELARLPEDFGTPPVEGLLFNTYALIQATAKDYVRDSQTRLILQPIARHLAACFGSVAALEQQMLRILTLMRRSETRASSYGVGNLINLMHHLQLDLSHYDFSNLTIRQAYLQKTPLHGVNLSNARLIACRFAEPVPYPTSLAVSADGDRIAIGGENGMIHTWQVSTGLPLHTLQAHSTYVFALAFTPDGETLVSGSMDSGVKFWDVNTGNCLQTWRLEHPWCLAFSPDGQFLVGSLGNQDRSIHLWHWRTGKVLQTFIGHSGPASGLVFIPRHSGVGPKSPRLVSAGQDGMVKIWDIDTGECLHTLAGYQGILWALGVHPEGRRFATGSPNHTLKIWDTETGNCLQTLVGHTAEVSSVSFSPDGAFLVSSSRDCTLRLWDTTTGQCLNILQGHEDGIRAAAFIAGYDSTGQWAAGQALVSLGMDQTVKFWDVSRSPLATSGVVPEKTASISGQCLKTIQGGSAGIRSFDPHPDGRLLASGGLDGVVRLWEVTGHLQRELRGHTGSVWKVAFHPDGQLLASISLNGEILIWDWATGQCLHSIATRQSWLQPLGFSPQGHLLSANGGEATIRFWHAQTGECWRTIPLDPDTYLVSVAFHPQGQYFISSSMDIKLRWWNLETGECFRVSSGEEGHCWAIAFHPEGHLFATIGRDMMVKLWNADTGVCMAQMPGHTGINGALAFSPDGTLLASGRSDRTIRLWDVATHQCVNLLEGHTSAITSLTFIPSSPDLPGEVQAPLLVSGSLDETICLWDVNTGRCLKRFRPDRLYEGLVITGAAGLTEGQRSSLVALGALWQPE